MTVSGDCIWNKICYTDEDTLKSFNCPYNGPGVPIEDEDAQRILLNRCPEIFTNCKLIQNLYQSFMLKFASGNIHG